MYCKNCGEENIDEAKFCKNCGQKLDDDVKKTEIMDEPFTNQNQENSSTTSTSSNDSGSDWLGCCLCLIGIFILFAIIGML